MNPSVKPSIFKFLNTLKDNNNRPWFSENKEYYLEEEGKIKSFFTSIFQGLQLQDNLEGMKAYRIYRDIRFSKDKSPYKLYRSCSYKRATTTLRGGYHLEITPNGSFLAVGFWQPNKEDLLRIRQEFELDADTITDILNSKEIKETFGGFHTRNTLKKAPKGFDKNHPNIQLINKKDFILLRKFTDKEVLHKNFHKTVLNSFDTIMPFFNYMSNILSTDLNGESLIGN